MSHENPDQVIEIQPNDRLLLANMALSVLHEFDRSAEVLIYLKALLNQSDVPTLENTDAFEVPYETFKDIGRLLQQRLQDEYDQRTVKVRGDERAYRVVFDPKVAQQRSQIGRRSIRGMGYIGNNHRPF